MKKIMSMFLALVMCISTVAINNVADAASKTAGFSFSDLKGQEFCFSSGAGAWSTELTVSKTGKITGIYQDSDMGSIGKKYPNGTIYYSEFTGKFTNLKKINKYTYSVKLTGLKYKNKPNTKKIKNKIKYIYTTAYGLEKGKTFYIYLPGVKLAKLPDSFREWTFLTDSYTTSKTLQHYGLYNVKMKYGFLG